MSKRKGKREPKTPMLSVLPTFAEAEERAILDTLQGWYSHLTIKLDSEAGHNVVRDDMLRQLERGETASLPLAYIVAMADAGHPPADHALRIYIHAAIDADRFGDLPVQVRAYSQRALTRPPLPIGYPSRQSQVVSNFVRDIGVAFFHEQILAHWPHVPPRYSNQFRHSAAWLVGLLFTRNGIQLSEQQVRRIVRARPMLTQRLAKFLVNE
jgi:hypothetical protein